ncbi:MAG: hypothetical protein V1789_10555, partial [PVC group bacterium]
DPGELSGRPEAYDGEYVRFRDIFSLFSTYYTNFEKDLNLSNNTSLKFRGEFCPVPCYLPNDEENKVLLSGLKSGDRITVLGKIMISSIPDDRMVLLSVHRVEQGWD